MNESLIDFFIKHKNDSIYIDGFKVGYNQRPFKGPWFFKYRTYVDDSVSILYVWPNNKIDTIYGKYYFPLKHQHEQNEFQNLTKMEFHISNKAMYGKYGCGNLLENSIFFDDLVNNQVSNYIFEKCFLHEFNVKDVNVYVSTNNFNSQANRKLADTLNKYFAKHINNGLPMEQFYDSVQIGFEKPIYSKGSRYKSDDYIKFYYGKQLIAELKK